MSKQKIDFFVPNTNIFGSKLHFFVPRSLTGQCFQHERGVSLVPWCKGTKSFTQNCPVWPKTGIFGQMLAFLPYLVPCQPENNANKVPNFCFLQKKLWFLAPKLPNLAQYMHFWSFWAKFGHFRPIWAHARPKNNANKVAGWFSDKWVPELMLPPKMIWINGPKMAKFGPKLAFFVKYWHF